MGKAIQIVKIDDESETHKFFLDEEALSEILNKDNIRDKPICIISVAGTTLTYFLLNVDLTQNENLLIFTYFRSFPERQIIPAELHVKIFEGMHIELMKT